MSLHQVQETPVSQAIRQKQRQNARLLEPYLYQTVRVTTVGDLMFIGRIVSLDEERAWMKLSGRAAPTGLVPVVLSIVAGVEEV
jgi:hypothetical protein